MPEAQSTITQSIQAVPTETIEQGLVQRDPETINHAIKKPTWHPDLDGRDLDNQHPISAITGLQGALDTIEAKDQEQDQSIESINTNLQEHVDSTNNPHSVTKAQVGLSNVDNTSDLQKPVSIAVQEELDKRVDKTDLYNKIYGTDANGIQTLYDKDSFGQVDDVQVSGVSVVQNKIANLGAMAGLNYSVLIRRL